MTPGALIFLGGKDVPKTSVLQVIDYKRRTIICTTYLPKFNRNGIPAHLIAVRRIIKGVY
jgi:hypothetical protein